MASTTSPAFQAGYQTVYQGEWRLLQLVEFSKKQGYETDEWDRPLTPMIDFILGICKRKRDEKAGKCS